MSRLLSVVGGADFLLLGTLHGLLTLLDVGTPRWFTPPDPALREAMQASGVSFHPEINLWRAWLGFNLTHSLGLMLFGGVYAYLGAFAPEALAASWRLQAVAVLVSGSYFAISRSFFFSGPTLGTGLGFAAFLAAAIL